MDITKRHVELDKMTKEQLIDYIMNGELNRFVARYADYDEDEDGHPRQDKRVPYIGWFWRDTDFVNGNIYIGDCGEFIGVMENNKWDYPMRRLSAGEALQVTNIVCEAHRINGCGGIVSEIEKDTKAKLEELWPLFQTFKIEKSGFWIHGMQGQVGHADTEEDADMMIKSLSDAAPGWRYWKVPV